MLLYELYALYGPISAYVLTVRGLMVYIWKHYKKERTNNGKELCQYIIAERARFVKYLNSHDEGGGVVLVKASEFP